MAVVVFDAAVIIGFRDARDAHYERAVASMRAASAPGTRKLLSAVNYTELLIGPLRAGGDELQALDAMLDAFAFELVHVDRKVAKLAAAVRARTNLKLPDAYAVATAVQARGGGDNVRLESFDARVTGAYATVTRGV